MLNPEQFSQRAVEMWDERTEGHVRLEPEGHMPLHEARKRIDPVFNDWDKFHRQERGYLEGLASHISKRGFVSPITLDPPELGGRIYDGHHRLAAAELAGETTIPWRHRDMSP